MNRLKKTLRNFGFWQNYGSVLRLEKFKYSKILAGLDDGSIKLWDLRYGRCLKTLHAHGGWVTCLLALPDNRFLSGSSDCSIKLWTPNGRYLRSFLGHRGLIAALVPLSPHRLVSAAEEEIKIWDLETGLCLQTLQAEEEVTCLTATPEGRIYVGTGEGNVQIWESEEIAQPHYHLIADLRSREYSRVPQVDWGDIDHIKILPDGHVIALGDNGIGLLWNVEDDRLLIKDHRVPSIKLLPLPLGNSLIVSNSEDVGIADVGLKNYETLLSLPLGAFTDVCFLPYGQLVTSYLTGEIKVWDIPEASINKSVFTTYTSTEVTKNA